MRVLREQHEQLARMLSRSLFGLDNFPQARRHYNTQLTEAAEMMPSTADDKW